MSENKDGGAHIPPQGMGTESKSLDPRSQRRIEPGVSESEMRALKYEILTEWLKQAHTLEEVEKICTQFTSGGVPVFMQEEADNLMQSIALVKKRAVEIGVPEIGVIQSVAADPVRRKLRAIFYPNAAGSVVATSEMREEAIRQAESKRRDAEATVITSMTNDTTRITPPSMAVADVQRTAIVSTPKNVPVAGPNDVTGKYPVMQPKKPWWKIW